MFKENKKSNKCMKINTIKLKDIYFNEIVLSMGRYKNRYFSTMNLHSWSCHT